MAGDRAFCPAPAVASHGHRRPNLGAGPVVPLRRRTRMRAHSRIVVTLLALFALVASVASAQGAWPSTPWQTMPGGDASGDRIDLALVARTGDLVGTRRVERIDAPSGYTTGSSVTVVLEGSEEEASRSLRTHLPYGAVLDLAVGDVVEVSAHS